MRTVTCVGHCKALAVGQIVEVNADLGICNVAGPSKRGFHWWGGLIIGLGVGALVVVLMYFMWRRQRRRLREIVASAALQTVRIVPQTNLTTLLQPLPRRLS